MNPGFSIGPVHIYYYGLILALAVWGAYGVVRRRARARQVPADAIDTLFVTTVPLGVIGARLYFVALSWSQYRSNPLRALAIWEGGLAIHGALLGGLLGLLLGYVWIKRRHKNIRLAVLLDLVAPALLLAQAIGRVANWVNQEAFGYPTNLPWGIAIDPARRPPEFAQSERFHPTFAYELIWNLLGFGLLILVERHWRKKGVSALNKRAGMLFALYMLWYSLGRAAIESLRTDSLYFGPWRAAQVFGVAAIIGAGLFIWYRKKAWQA